MARPTRGNGKPSSSASGEADKKVRVARFGAPHGVRGEVKLWSFTEDSMAIADYAPLETADGTRTFEFESLRPAKDHLVARLKGVADRDAAELLRNIDLYVPRDRLPPIDDDTYYFTDLVGLSAVNPDGTAFGTVLAVHNFGAGDLIEIQPTAGGNTLLFPFSEAVVPEVNLKAGRIVIVPPTEIIADPDRDGSET